MENGGRFVLPHCVPFPENDNGLGRRETVEEDSQWGKTDVKVSTSTLN